MKTDLWLRGEQMKTVDKGILSYSVWAVRTQKQKNCFYCVLLILLKLHSCVQSTRVKSFIFLFSGVQFSKSDLFSLLCLWLENPLKKIKCFSFSMIRCNFLCSGRYYKNRHKLSHTKKTTTKNNFYLLSFTHCNNNRKHFLGK